jgi:hypothetical protein
MNRHDKGYSSITKPIFRKHVAIHQSDKNGSDR